MGTFEKLEEVIKSPADKKEYRAIKLKNSLNVLLISDSSGFSETESGETEEEIVEDAVEELEEESSDEAEDDDYEEDGPSSTKCAAAAMCVNVGGFHEPHHVGGLAHFCEHMLFMGSEKYPDENAFSSFVSKYSGSDNAHTDTHCTVYNFDVRQAIHVTVLFTLRYKKIGIVIY